MIFANIWSIVTDHYSSLAEETALKYPADYVLLAIIFGVVPLVCGLGLAYYVLLWPEFITASASVLSVLTGFSINTIILLMRYDPEGSHPYEQKTVRKTKEFTLYAILSGVLLIVFLILGFVISRGSSEFGAYVALGVSGVVYSLMIHYFLTLMVITHRLHSLIHSEVF